MNKKTKAVILIIIFSTGLGIMLGFPIGYNWENKTISDLKYHWICMDGCFFMEEIILGKLNHSNNTQKEYHRLCSDVCFNQIFNVTNNSP